MDGVAFGRFYVLTFLVNYMETVHVNDINAYPKRKRPLWSRVCSLGFGFLKEKLVRDKKGKKVCFYYFKLERKVYFIFLSYSIEV